MKERGFKYLIELNIINIIEKKNNYAAILLSPISYNLYKLKVFKSKYRLLNDSNEISLWIIVAFVKRVHAANSCSRADIQPLTLLLTITIM